MCTSVTEAAKIVVNEIETKYSKWRDRTKNNVPYVALEEMDRNKQLVIDYILGIIGVTDDEVNVFFKGRAH